MSRYRGMGTFGYLEAGVWIFSDIWIQGCGYFRISGYSDMDISIAGYRDMDVFGYLDTGVR
eukprot:6129841-Karenia_brevis.AAC.1